MFQTRGTLILSSDASNSFRVTAIPLVSSMQDHCSGGLAFRNTGVRPPQFTKIDSDSIISKKLAIFLRLLTDEPWTSSLTFVLTYKIPAVLSWLCHHDDCSTTAKCLLAKRQTTITTATQVLFPILSSPIAQCLAVQEL